MGIIGLVASDEGWVRFEPAWRGVLDAYELPYFHATDCEQGRRIFKDRELWPRPRRAALVAELLGVIALAGPRIVGAVMSLDAWRALSKDDRSLFLNAWFPCMQECVRLAAAIAVTEQAACELVFSQQEEFAGRAAGLWDVLRRSHIPGIEHVRGYRMADMRDSLPLQAADLVAYELTKSAPTIAVGGDLRPATGALLMIDPFMFISDLDAGYLTWQVEGARLVEDRIKG
jgi:hypothetical protein